MAKEEFLFYRYTGETHDDHESLYFQPFYNILGDDILDDAMVGYIKKDDFGGYWRGEGSPLEVSYMEEVIKKLKKEGATHMEIMFHCDHDSYCISGVEIRKPSEEEINDHLTIELSEKRKANIKKREALYKEIEKLKEEYEELDNK